MPVMGNGLGVMPLTSLGCKVQRCVALVVRFVHVDTRQLQEQFQKVCQIRRADVRNGRLKRGERILLVKRIVRYFVLEYGYVLTLCWLKGGRYNEKDSMFNVCMIYEVSSFVPHRNVMSCR